MIIDGKTFTLFWDIDRDALTDLAFAGRVEWLRLRLTTTLLRPLEVLEKADASAEVWLAIAELVCAGIDALGGFYGGKKNGNDSAFCRFVDKFMHNDFRKTALDVDGKARSYCWHLQTYFRNGLAHGFGIECGRLWKADATGCELGYLRPNGNGCGVAICPQLLLEDFRRAVGKYFDELLHEGESTLMGRAFSERFEKVRTRRGQRK